MEITTFQTYLIVILDNVRTTLHVLAVLSGLFTLICMGFFAGNAIDEVDTNTVLKWFKRGLAFFLLSIFLSTVLPSTNKMIAITVIPKIVNNKDIQDISNETIKAIGLLINEEIDNVKKRK